MHLREVEYQGGWLKTDLIAIAENLPSNQVEF